MHLCSEFANERILKWEFRGPTNPYILVPHRRPPNFGILTRSFFADVVFFLIIANLCISRLLSHYEAKTIECYVFSSHYRNWVCSNKSDPGYDP